MGIECMGIECLENKAISEYAGGTLCWLDCNVSITALYHGRVK